VQALVFESGREKVREIPRPRPRRGFALVEVIASGICNTDLELRRGYHAFRGVPGHEFVGRVVGPAGSCLLGTRVVGEINLGCGRCTWCARELSRHCPRRRVLGILGHPGAHAELLTLPEANLHEVPAGVSDEEAVFTEPLAAACQILDQVRVDPLTRAAVLGAGKLGRLVVIASGITGSPRGMPRALRLVKPRGTIVWKSTHHAPARFDAAPLVVNEVTVVGSRCGRFEPALALLASGAVKVRPLLAAEFPLAHARAALREAARPGVLKVLLRPGGAA
jgi:threonine dehydrogenase-like Zn-dependent dehydrogenase